MSGKTETAVPRPAQHLHELRRRHPKVWDLVEYARARRGGWVTPEGRDLPDWPSWCYLPVGGGQSIAAMLSLKEPGISVKIAGFSAWRAAQGIYRIHPDLMDAVWSTPISGKLPIELLFHLPEWCVYVETPGRSLVDIGVLHGFWAFLDYDLLSHRPQLFLMFDCDLQFMNVDRESGEQYVGSSPFFGLPLIPEADLESCVQELMRESDRDVGTSFSGVSDVREFAEALTPLLAVVLYLCSETAEYRDARGSPAQPAHPKPVRTKKGRPPKIIPPVQPRVWEVSYRLGAALRAARDRAEQEGSERTHASPRPHVRRAHWHTFLAGPRDGPRERRLRWLPPIPIGVQDLDDLVPVVRAVSGRSDEGGGES